MADRANDNSCRLQSRIFYVAVIQFSQWRMHPSIVQCGHYVSSSQFPKSLFPFLFQKGERERHNVVTPHTKFKGVPILLCSRPTSYARSYTSVNYHQLQVLVDQKCYARASPLYACLRRTKVRQYCACCAMSFQFVSSWGFILAYESDIW